MGLKIKLLRIGRKKRPYYRIVVGQSCGGRKGKYLEKLGEYDCGVGNKAGEKLLLVNKRRFEYWLLKGAQSTKRVEKLIMRNYGYIKENREKGDV